MAQVPAAAGGGGAGPMLGCFGQESHDEDGARRVVWRSECGVGLRSTNIASRWDGLVLAKTSAGGRPTGSSLPDGHHDAGHGSQAVSGCIVEQRSKGNSAMRQVRRCWTGRLVQRLLRRPCLCCCPRHRDCHAEACRTFARDPPTTSPAGLAQLASPAFVIELQGLFVPMVAVLLTLDSGQFSIALLPPLTGWSARSGAAPSACSGTPTAASPTNYHRDLPDQPRLSPHELAGSLGLAGLAIHHDAPTLDPIDG